MSVDDHAEALAGPQQNVAFIEQNDLWPKIRHLLRLMTSAEIRPETTSKIAAMRVPDNANDAMAQLDEFRTLARPFFADADEFRNIDANAANAVITVAYWEITGLSVLFELWWDPKISEIMVDAFDRVVVERGGRLHATTIRFRDPDHVRDIAKRLAKAVSDRDLSPANPLVTAELPGARIALAIDRVVKTGVSISIRKFPPLMGMDDLMGFGALSEEMREFLTACVVARATTLVSGGTGTGKTTFINSLSESIPDTERVVTIEDAYELALNTPHWVAMQSRERSSGDDMISVTLADLLRASLRMRPDRIVVGEIREPAGATVMLQAANTGHDGTMTTLHATSVERAVSFRLPGLLRRDKESGGMPNEVAIAEVASAIELVVQIVREHGRRYVKEIAVIDETFMVDSELTPVTIFRGHLNADGIPTFEQVGQVPPDTSIGMKLAESSSGRCWVQEES